MRISLKVWKRWVRSLVNARTVRVKMLPGLCVRSALERLPWWSGLCAVPVKGMGLFGIAFLVAPLGLLQI
jgi:hypothetical protein